jgi:uncharacterized protein (TIGR02996 family)
VNREGAEMLDGEYEWLSAVVANLADDNTKLVYADWLQERGDNDRATFLRAIVASLVITAGVYAWLLLLLASG